MGRCGLAVVSIRRDEGSLSGLARNPMGFESILVVEEDLGKARLEVMLRAEPDGSDAVCC